MRIDRKKYMSSLREISLILSMLFMGSLIVSCGHSDEPKPPVNEKRDLTVLLYAVASNDLESYLESDKSEILRAAAGMDMSGLSLVVYQVTSKGDPSLLEVSKDASGQCSYKEVKGYDRSVYSTDPRRISEVVEDVRKLRNAEKYGLVLWSHGTGLDPAFPTHGAAPASAVMEYIPDASFSFGADKDKGKDPDYTDAIDIDELADALPDGLFDFIWFDACYMSGIETIYQLRNKCSRFVGYPTEVFNPGMPYDLTVPFFLKKQPDLVGGAKAFFNYYNENSDYQLRVATACVVDMSAIEDVAAACSDIYRGADGVPSADGMICYTRRRVGPFYDFGQYSRKMAELNPGKPSVDGFDRAMDRFIVWSAASDVDFNYRPIDPDGFSGISCFLYNPSSITAKSEYYRTLDWYKRVYKAD